MTLTQYSLIDLFDPNEKEKLMEQMNAHSRFDLEWILSTLQEKRCKKLSDMGYNEGSKVISLTFHNEAEETEQISLVISIRSVFPFE